MGAGEPAQEFEPWPSQADMDLLIHLDREKLSFIGEMMVPNKYLCPKPLTDKYFACIWPAGFVTSLLVCQYGDRASVINRWDYHDARDALAALRRWDGTGEPTGWHRHPYSGRRLAESDNDFDDDNQRVPIGQIYMRR